MAVKAVVLLFACTALLFTSCSQIQKPETEAFFAGTPPPPKQEFRWTNGKMPKSFDPARAAAAPETDIVRTIFEGLTEIDAQTLETIPAAAEKWSSSADMRVWTFQLRKDGRWTNGRRVTANDFVTSWKRLAALGDKTAHRDLIQNIIGLKAEKAGAITPPIGSTNLNGLVKDVEIPLKSPIADPNPAVRNDEHRSEPATVEVLPSKKAETGAVKKFGVESVGELTLKVSLELPDKDFPKLVANPIFRPIYGDGAEFEDLPLNPEIVSNGPFSVSEIGKDGIVVNRSVSYWNKAAVGLERIRFVSKDTAEVALDAYKKGEVDAVTNAEFEPLALKLLEPFEDFRQTTHSALNFYEFNTKNIPFSDRRVREALAISIDRERLTDGELEGATEPAATFLPLGDKEIAGLNLDIEKARDLLVKAGYPNGQNFRPIRLVINRNDTQQRVARTVARMWKQNLNLETQIVVKEASEIEAVKAAGEYDLLRRGVVLPTIDEMVSLTSIFGTAVRNAESVAKEPSSAKILAETAPGLKKKDEKGGPSDAGSAADAANEPPQMLTLLTEEDTLYELKAIPLYFPISYSLVKPYVRGFEMNGLDAPSLKDVSIDSSWQPKR